MSIQDVSEQATNVIIGDTLALIGALCYAFYTLLLKKLIPDEKLISMPMFFGIGIYTS